MGCGKNKQIQKYSNKKRETWGKKWNICSIEFLDGGKLVYVCGCSVGIADGSWWGHWVEGHIYPEICSQGRVGAAMEGLSSSTQLSSWLEGLDVAECRSQTPVSTMGDN